MRRPSGEASGTRSDVFGLGGCAVVLAITYQFVVGKLEAWRVMVSEMSQSSRWAGCHYY
jgi:hypothetical protein